MRLLRTLTSTAQRPSIYEIAASILTPTPPCRAAHTTLHTNLRSNQTQASGAIATQQRCIGGAAAAAQPQRQLSTSRQQHKGSITRPTSRDRGPASEETTQTDFNVLDVLGATPAPSTAVDACLWDGFHLNSGVKVTGGAGVLLVAGEAFAWRPWEAKGLSGAKWLLNDKGQWEVGDEAWGLLAVVWPKPGEFFCSLEMGMECGSWLICGSFFIE